MAEFRVIDADSHVEEPEEAWGYLDPKYEARRPFPITGENRPFLHNMNSFWYIDGSVYPKVAGQGVTIYATPVTMARAKLKPFSLDSQTLLEPAARLKDMDAGGVDVQVIFPTIFLEPLSEDPRFEAALMKSYNSWMASACSKYPDRLKWAAVLPMRSVPEAVEETRRAKDLGAVGLAVYGTVGETLLSHEDFDPVWSEAERAQASSLRAHRLVPSGPQASLHRQLRRPRPRLYAARYDGFLRVCGWRDLRSFSAAQSCLFGSWCRLGSLPDRTDGSLLSLRDCQPPTAPQAASERVRARLRGLLHLRGRGEARATGHRVCRRGPDHDLGRHASRGGARGLRRGDPGAGRPERRRQAAAPWRQRR